MNIVRISWKLNLTQRNPKNVFKISVNILVSIKNGTKSHGQNLISWKRYCASYYDVSVNKYSAKCETSLRF